MIKKYEQFIFESLDDKIPLALNCIRDHKNFIAHPTTSHWGGSVLIMEKNGKAFGRLYWFIEDDTSIYLDWLSVEKDSRKKGMGTELQKIREEMGRAMGAETAYLWVKKDSWMHDWYQRRGYKFYKDYDGEENSVWMEKNI